MEENGKKFMYPFCRNACVYKPLAMARCVKPLASLKGQEPEHVALFGCNPSVRTVRLSV